MRSLSARNLVVLLAALCVACTKPQDPLERLEALLEVRAYVDLQLAIDDYSYANGPEWVEAHAQLLRRYLVLASAGLGDCGPAEELLNDPTPGLAERRVASLASHAASLAVLHRDDKPWTWRESDFIAPDIVAWNDRVNAAECVLQEARRRFPAAAQQITERLGEVQAQRIDASTLSKGWTRPLVYPMGCTGY